VRRVDNTAEAFQKLQDMGVKMVNVGAVDIVDGNVKLMLGMMCVLVF
jgi:hypothetical protein